MAIRRLNQKPQTLFSGKLKESAANTFTSKRIKTNCFYRAGKVQAMELMAIYHRTDDPDIAISSITQMLTTEEIAAGTLDYNVPTMIWRNRWTTAGGVNLILDQISVEQKTELHEAGQGQILCTNEVWYHIVAANQSDPIEGSFRVVGYWVEMTFMEALPYILETLQW